MGRPVQFANDDRYDNLTDEELEVYIKEKARKDLFAEVSNDYSISSAVATLAGYMVLTGLDPASQESIDNLRRKNPETGAYETLGLKAIDPATKENFVSFLSTLIEILRGSEEPIYDFNKYNDKEHKFSAYKNNVVTGSVTSLSINKNVNPPVEPKSVKKPNLFKRITNSWFGWFNAEVSSYNDYTERKTVYDREIEKHNIDKAAKEEILNNNKQLYEKKNNKLAVYMKVISQINNNLTKEEKLKDLSEQAAKSDMSIDVCSGKSNVLLGRHKNYVNLIQTPLESHTKLPMSGLALLVANSLTINRNVIDASSQYAQKYNSKDPLNAEEQKYTEQLEIAMENANVGGKIMESLFGGGDVSRMGDRAISVVEGRKELNKAAKEYEEGNKKPLVDLINDSIEIVYGFVRDTGKKINESGAKALIEISNALEKLFNDDHELRTMVNISDEKLIAMKGAARLYSIVQDPQKKLYEGYINDGGPGSQNRNEFVEEKIFENMLINIVATSVAKNRNKADAVFEKQISDPFVTNLLAKFKPEDMVNVTTGLRSYIMAENMPIPNIYVTFAKDPFEPSAIKKKMIDSVKDFPEFKELLNMDKDTLFSQDFSTISENLISKSIQQKNALETSDLEISKNEMKSKDDMKIEEYTIIDIMEMH